jgi:hypothetical protein
MPPALTAQTTPRTLAPMCPHCGREAPLVYRGPLAYCSACDKPRPPLSAAGVNITGKPAKVGGTLASVLGWVVLGLTLAIALSVGALLQAILPPAGLVIGGVIAVVGIAAALVLLLGGRFLTRTGDRAALGAKSEAVRALAQNQKGIVRTELVARSLGMPVQEADAFLTSLSRQPDSGVILEVDNDGKLYYRFAEFAPEVPWPPPGTPLEPAPVALPAENTGLRVAKTELTSPQKTQLADPLPEEGIGSEVSTVDETSTKRSRALP